MRGFCNALKDSAFIAIDTEHVAITSERDRLLDQVGLAYIQNIAQQDSIPSRVKPDLQQFYTSNNIQTLTLNINLSQERKDELSRLGGKGMPARRAHRFGQEQRVSLQDLAAITVEFIQSCNKAKKNLVLVGFAMAAKWTYLSRYFPQAMPFFSSWVDLRDIAKDATSSIGAIPGLVSLLQLFGYHWKDIQPGRSLNSGIADNAGDDAVATFALASALLSSKNQEKLRFRQECGRIARIFTKKKGYQQPRLQDRFTVTIYTQGPLPTAINSAMKMARHFFSYSPELAGVISNDVAFLTFKSQGLMDQFITAVHGSSLPTGEMLSVQHYFQECKPSENEKKERREKKEDRIRKRAGRAESESGNLHLGVGFDLLFY
ncbi:hypothetical protein F66182_2292 [Fusarium sp. NRRL 66182]|nr:hypothetical protein F66182_2292 [Fusarium sp. NRRL 66182]